MEVSNLPKNPVIGIVGGRGEMGICLQDFFKRQGFKSILISGRKPDKKEKIISNEELIEKSDVVIVSVTLENTVEVIKELAPKLKAGQLFIDVSSIKKPQVEAMLKSQAEVLGTHPMFGRGVSFFGQVVVVCPARIKVWKGWFEKLLENEGVKIIKLSPKEHDQRVPFVQALPHLLGFIFAETLQKSGKSIDKILELSTPNAKILLDFTARVISQNPKLVREIQKANPANKTMRDSLEEVVSRWNQLIDSGTSQEVEKNLTANKDFFKSFLKEGQEEAQLFLDTITRRGLKIEGFEKPRGTPKGNQQPAAVFGGEGSNTHEAAEKFFKIERKGSFLKFFTSIKSVFEAVKNGKARIGIVPLENETGGIIRETFDQLLDNEGKIKIRTLVEMRIHHAVAVAPETDNSQIKTIYSHHQALSQCVENILKRFPGVRSVATLSTIEALEIVKDLKLKYAAAIGPEGAAKKMGLRIIEQNFQDKDENITTFAVIATSHSRSAKEENTLVAFNFLENKPGQLADVLDIFRDAKINLSKIISIPRRENEFAFFIELENSPNVAGALKKAEKKSKTLFKFSNYRKRSV